MRLQMSLTVRSQAHKAGLHSLQFGFTAHITGNFSRLHGSAADVVLFSEPSDQTFDKGVDPQLRSGGKMLFTYGTVAEKITVPVFADAAFTEVVSAWCADWIGEHIQTDGALELILYLRGSARKHVSIRVGFSLRNEIGRAHV